MWITLDTGAVIEATPEQAEAIRELQREFAQWLNGTSYAATVAFLAGTGLTTDEAVEAVYEALNWVLEDGPGGFIAPAPEQQQAVILGPGEVAVSPEVRTTLTT